jgi:hypothetical protein
MLNIQPRIYCGQENKESQNVDGQKDERTCKRGYSARQKNQEMRYGNET